MDQDFADNVPAVAADRVAPPCTVPRRAVRRPFKSPLTALAASFALGIVWAYWAQSVESLYGFICGAAACILIGLLLLRTGRDRAAVVLVLAGMTLAGFAATRRWEHRFPSHHVRYLESLEADLHDPVRLEGRVISTPGRTGYAWQFDVEARRIESHGQSFPVSGKIRVRMPSPDVGDASGKDGPVEIQYGDEIQAEVRLRPPHSYQNPGSFDFRRWMQDIEDVYWVGTVQNPHSAKRVGHAAGFHPAEIVERARRRLLRAIDDVYPPWTAQGRYGAVLKAALWGDRTALDSGTIDDFRKTGLYHLLVIAGLHVGLLTLLVEFLLKALRCPRLLRACLVLGFLMVYALLVEQRAPTLRATLMIATYLVARIIDREHSPLNAIGGVALVLLYVRPAWLFEAGFQLSFAAALLIVCVAVPILERTTEPYRKALRRLDDVLLDDGFPPRIAQARLDWRALVQSLRRRFRLLQRFPAFSRNIVVAPLKLLVWVANMLIFSAALQLGLLLPMVETFHRVTFAGVGLNALAIPVMTLLLALALPVNLLSVASPAAAAGPAKLLSLVMALLFQMTHLPGLASWLSYRMPQPPAWVAWGFCAAFVGAGWALRGSRWDSRLGNKPTGYTASARFVGVALAACAVFVILVAVHPFAPRLRQGVAQLTALDCGAGDAVFVAFPNGTTMLLDAGGSSARGAQEGSVQGQRWNSGEDIVSPYLWSLGVKRIDVVALTQASSDHAGGMYPIIENFRVGEFWHAPQAETPEFGALLNTLAEHHIPTRTLMAGDALAIGNSTIRVLRPERSFIDAQPSARLRNPGPNGGSPTSSGSNDSLILRITGREMNFLLSGDAGKDTQRALVASHEPLESQVLALGLHGLNPVADPEFMAQVAPRIVLMTSEIARSRDDSQKSTAPRNLPSASISAFRTDSDGATTVEWDGQSLRVQTYKTSQGAKRQRELKIMVPN